MPSARFDDTLAYVKERKQFGKPVGSFQALSHRIAALATEIEATRLLVYNTALQVVEDPSALFPREASMVNSRRPSWPNTPRWRACR
jgi:alkylation response protein AidB-like acyl-CoA dehydrogenase